MNRIVNLLLLIFVLFSANNNIKANDINYNEEFSNLYGGSTFDYLESVKPTSDGGYIAAGRASSSFASSPNHGQYDGWIIKVDTSGQVEWSKLYGTSNSDYIEDIEVTSDGGYVATGSVSVASNYTEAWILKVDSAGNQLFSQQYAKSTNMNKLNSIKQTSDGGYVVAGIHNQDRGLNKGYDGWFMKVDSLGNELFSKHFSSNEDDVLYEINHTNDNGFILAGQIGTTSSGPNDGWLLKLDSLGNTEFSKRYHNTGASYLYSAIETSDGGYIATGYTYGNATDTTSFGFNDGWIIKTDSTGNESWSKQYGGAGQDVFQSIIQTSDNNFVVVGYVASSVNNTTHLGAWDGYLLKIDNNGIDIFSRNLGNNSGDRINYVVETNDGGLILAGSSRSSMSNSTNNGVENGWIIKFDHEYKISFNANGGIGTMNDLPIKKDINKSLSINNYTNSNKIFVGWSTSINGPVVYNDGASYTHALKSNITLYAVWANSLTYSLRYDGNGHSSGKVPVDKNSYQLNQKAIVNNQGTLNRDDYKFVNWNTNKNGTGISYNINDKITIDKNIVLYAVWTKNIIKDDIILPKSGKQNIIIYCISLLLISVSIRKRVEF